jgi:hypothetical protein
LIIPELRQELGMTSEELVKKVKELLDTDADLDFLLVLKKNDLEKLVACVRARVDQVGNNGRRLTKQHQANRM